MERRADFLIIGSGIAGLRAAAELAGAGRVLIVTKADPRAGNTGYAQGGIAAAVGAGDTLALHAADTMAAGDGLCDAQAVQVLVEDGPRYVRELVAWGAAFDRDAAGELALAIEGAHSARRVLHARDATGREIGRALWSRVRDLADVVTCDHARVVDLIVEDGRCAGVRFLRDAGGIETARGRAVLLATGGAGQIYSETTNPPVATGDGVAVGYRAGARVGDLEFVQFHPTALNVPGQPRFLLSEALRGEGAHLVNHRGDRFMARYDPAGELAPRDRVARAIVREAEATGHPVCLRLSHLDPAFVHARFPLISAACRNAGLDLARDAIPVGPAAHYVMGGVVTDLDGRTSLPGLYAAGEVACTGVHGANRLASNSLLEGLVFGARAGAAMKNDRVQGSGFPVQGSEFQVHRPRPERDRPEPARGESSASARERGWGPASGKQRTREREARAGGAPRTQNEVAGSARIGDSAVTRDAVTASEIQTLMWRHVGLFRDRDGLQSALDVLEPAWQHLNARLGRGEELSDEEWRTASLLTVGRLAARAALRREESRGAHYRTDYPQRDDIHWKLRLFDVSDRDETRKK